MQELAEMAQEKSTVLNELLGFYYNKNIEIEKTALKLIIELAKD